MSVEGPPDCTLHLSGHCNHIHYQRWHSSKTQFYANRAGEQAQPSPVQSVLSSVLQSAPPESDRKFLKQPPGPIRLEKATAKKQGNSAIMAGKKLRKCHKMPSKQQKRQLQPSSNILCYSPG